MWHSKFDDPEWKKQWLEHKTKVKVRVVETGDIYVGLKSACEGLGVKSRGQISKAIYEPWRTVKGCHVEMVE